MRLSKLAGVLCAFALLSGAAIAQVKVAYVGEISGPLAPSGGNFRDGVILAVEEINAKGGVLKQKLALTLYDTQTNPGVARAQMQKAIDGDPYVIFGPILSGNVKVTLDPRPNRPQVIQSCDCYVDRNGLMYLTDPNAGLNILQFEGL